MIAFSGMSMAHTIENVSSDLDGEPAKPKMVSCKRTVVKDCAMAIRLHLLLQLAYLREINIDMGKACSAALAAANYNSSIAACPE